MYRPLTCVATSASGESCHSDAAYHQRNGPTAEMAEALLGLGDHGARCTDFCLANHARGFDIHDNTKLHINQTDDRISKDRLALLSPSPLRRRIRPSTCTHPCPKLYIEVVHNEGTRQEILSIWLEVIAERGRSKGFLVECEVPVTELPESNY